MLWTKLATRYRIGGWGGEVFVIRYRRLGRIKGLVKLVSNESPDAIYKYLFPFAFRRSEVWRCYVKHVPHESSDAMSFKLCFIVFWLTFIGSGHGHRAFKTIQYKIPDPISASGYGVVLGLFKICSG